QIVLDLRPKVVGGHVMHRPGAKDTLAVELAAIEQHLPKADVVADGGKRAGSGTVELRWRVEKLDHLRLSREGVIGKRTGETVALPLRRVERGVFHAERPPHIRSQIVAE